MVLTMHFDQATIAAWVKDNPEAFPDDPEQKEKAKQFITYCLKLILQQLGISVIISANDLLQALEALKSQSKRMGLDLALLDLVKQILGEGDAYERFVEQWKEL